MGHNSIRKLVGCALASASIAAIGIPAGSTANAQSSAERRFDIPAQDLAAALEAFGRQSGKEIIFDRAQLAGRRSGAVRGSHTAFEALRRLLLPSGLSMRMANPNTFVVQNGNGRAGSPPPGEGEAGSGAADIGAGTSDILVTGTRIRGANTPSPSIQVTRRQIEEGGFNDLGEVARSIPQNFNGGQNPGVTIGSGGTVNQNATGGSGINLRGLGPDATLTLLNGRRLAYGGFNQSIDVSAIPVGAVERLEIIPDGASAIYGSDAVAGVANIITRRRFSGLETMARIGEATSGGLEQKTASVVAGTDWGAGGIMLAYEYRDEEEVVATQRSYLRGVAPASTLYPSSRTHSAFAQVRQRLGSGLLLSVDGLFLDRGSTTRFGISSLLLTSNRKNQAYTIAPRLTITGPASWVADLSGSYSRDETLIDSATLAANGTQLSSSTLCYCNDTFNIEGIGEGPLFSAPGGAVRLAIGAGYRKVAIDPTSPTSSFRGGAFSSRYAFGELLVPLVAPDMTVPGVNRLSVTGAVRHERYSEVGKVTTPKLGFIYEPVRGVELKGSWGRAFKAPTLNQQYTAPFVFLYPAASFGATGYPANATVLSIAGGGGELRPERAVSRTVTLSLRPVAVPGLLLEATYFDIDYVDRVVQPLGSLSRTFIDPALAQFLELAPSAQAQANLIARSERALINFVGAPYNPANVIAIAYNTYANVARQSAAGVDLSGAYSFPLANGEATLTGTASWLRGDQQNSPGTEVQDTVGFVYNPAKFRARAGIGWRGDGMSVAVFANHTGAVMDNQRAKIVRGDAFTTIDVTLRYDTGERSSPLSNVELGLTIQNLINEPPPYLLAPVPGAFPFDSTNYSALGRTVSFSIRKRW